MGKKDKKSKTAEQKARVAAKQSKKAAKGDKKAKNRAVREEDSDAEDIDLDAVLAAYAEEQAKFLKVTEAVCTPPSPRSSSTIIASPSSRKELFVFGGESFDGTVASFYSNLFVYLIDRNEWREITSPNTPLPRSGHAWCRGGNSGGIYLFGGEFSSPKQGTFYHYNDFWYLDPSSREWSRIETKGKGPPARSGHRMTYYKNYILLFGGFQDTSQQTKYLQDLWIYDTQNFIWHNPTLPAASQKPDPRSSFSFLPHDTGAVIYGGYSRIKVTANKHGKAVAKTTLQPVIHQDTWFLRLVPPEQSGPTCPTIRWERRKKPANPPNPLRAGATMAYHKGRGIMFGGVYDVEESEDGIDSEFFNNLFAWNTDRNRFFPLTLRRPKTSIKKQGANQGPRGRNRGKADEEALLRNLAALENKVGLTPKTDQMELDERRDGAADGSDNDDSDKIDVPTRFEFPHPRFNAQLAVQDDSLFIFGGTVERGDQEFTFDDFYRLDLGKLDGVRELHFNEPERWNEVMEVDSEDSDEDENEDFGSDYDEMEDDVSTPATEMTNLSLGTITKSDMQVDAIETETEKETTSEKDGKPYPRPFETLREFSARTSNDWQNVILESLKYGASNKEEQSIKELRKQAFAMAEERWWECREEIRVLEDEQEEAGIGEVVSLADRAGAASGTGRRR